MDSKKPFIVGIAGGTGSGKTTIARKIVDHFNKNILHIPHDRYYNDQSHLKMEERIKTNYDHPKALETDLFITQLEELIKGNSVQMPQYDFTTHTRKKETITEKPAPLILLEGILIYENKKLSDFIDLRIFVDVAADIRVLRKIDRDVKERGRTMEMSIDQYFDTTRPMHEQFVEPTKQFADIIIPHGGYNEEGIQTIIDTIEKRLQTLK